MNPESLWITHSDIDKHALQQLQKAKTEKIFIVGRGGTRQFKGTRKELKEIRERPSDVCAVSVLDHGGSEAGIFGTENDYKNFKGAQRKDMKLRGKFRTWA